MLDKQTLCWLIFNDHLNMAITQFPLVASGSPAVLGKFFDAASHESRTASAVARTRQA
jgi:hypothetical protein